MAEAKRDQNRVPTMIAVSNADNETPVTLYADPVTHRLLVSGSGGSGSPGGSNTQVQFNDSGSFGGDAGFTYNKTTDTATLAGDLKADRVGLEDTDSSHYLYIDPGSNLSADRTLTVTTGDANRTVTISGDLTVSSTATVSGTNTGDVTLSGTPDYITISGQTITRGQIDQATDVTGVLPVANGGTNASSAGITAFNNITGYSASGATGTTSTNLVFSTSPTLTTPNIGAATATTINGATITSTSAGTLTLANNSTLATSGANSITLTSTGATNVTLPTTGTLSTLAGTEELDNKTLDASVAKGTWTSSSWGIPAGTLSGSVTFGENTALIYDAALSADGTYCGLVRAGTAGTTLAFGDLVYLAAVDSRWELADADAASTSGDVLLGMCVQAAASDGSATTILLQGFIRADAAFPTLTIGGPAYVSTTAGDIQTTMPSGTDDVIRRVGFAWTADELYFNPSNDYVTRV